MFISYSKTNRDLLLFCAIIIIIIMMMMRSYNALCASQILPLVTGPVHQPNGIPWKIKKKTLIMINDNYLLTMMIMIIEDRINILI